LVFIVIVTRLRLFFHFLYVALVIKQCFPTHSRTGVLFPKDGLLWLAELALWHIFIVLATSDPCLAGSFVGIAGIVSFCKWVVLGVNI
jgi:hypothetical protein